MNGTGSLRSFVKYSTATATAAWSSALAAGNAFGCSVSASPGSDFNSDTNIDLVIGSCYRNTVTFIYLASGTQVKSFTIIDSTKVPITAGDQFGMGAKAGRDLNGDGHVRGDEVRGGRRE